MQLPDDLMISLNETFETNFNVVNKQNAKVRAISNNNY